MKTGDIVICKKNNNRLNKGDIYIVKSCLENLISIHGFENAGTYITFNRYRRNIDLYLGGRIQELIFTNFPNDENNSNNSFLADNFIVLSNLDNIDQFIVGMFKCKINNNITRLFNMQMTLGDYILSYSPEYFITYNLIINNIRLHKNIVNEIVDISSIKALNNVLKENEYYSHVGESLILEDIVDNAEKFELFKTIIVNSYINSESRVVTATFCDQSFDFLTISDYNALGLNLNGNLINVNYNVRRHNDELYLNSQTYRFEIDNKGLEINYEIQSQSSESRINEINNNLYLEYVSKVKKMINPNKKSDLSQYNFKTEELVWLKDDNQINLCPSIIISRLDNVVQLSNTIVTVMYKDYNGIIGIKDVELNKLNKPKGSTIKEMMSIAVKVIDNKLSGEIFGFSKVKEKLVGSILTLIAIENNFNCKKDKKERDTVILATENSQYRFVKSEVEFLFPKYNIVEPKKDYTIYVNSICKLLDDRNLKGIKKGAKVKVISITKTDRSRNSSKISKSKIDQRKLDRVKFVDCETNIEYNSYLKRLKII